MSSPSYDRLFDVDSPHVALRRDARPVERLGGRQAIGRSGTHRERIFYYVGAGPGASKAGATSVEIFYWLGRRNPCPVCACEHRGPIPVNQIGTRLQELRDWGYLTYDLDADGTPLTRRHASGRTAEIHMLTGVGEAEWTRRYG